MKTTTLALAAILSVAATSSLFAADPIMRAPKVIYAAPEATVVAPVATVAVMVPEAPPPYIVDQGPHYSGPALMDFPKPVFHQDAAIRPYPYVRTWEAAQAAQMELMQRPPVVRYRAPISRLN